MKTEGVLKTVVLAALIFFTGQQVQALTGEVIKKSKLKCMPKTEYNSKGKPISCELSGVAYIRGRLYVASDWWKNQKPSLFFWNWNGQSDINSLPEVINSSMAVSTRKFEDMMVFPDKKTILASTSFGYGPLWDEVWVPMNRMVYWSAYSSDNYAYMLRHDSGVSTETVRNRILETVQTRYPETQFINVEGFTALPDNQILLGIRQIGSTFRNTSFTSLLIRISYRTFGLGQYLLTGNFEIVDELDFSGAGLPELTSLSSLEYDFETNTLYALTSYESDNPAESFASYIWELKPEGEFYQPEVATNCKGEVLKLHHKAEGLAKIKGNKFVIVSDDDRQLSSNGDTRLPEEAYFYIVELGKSNCS